MSALGNTILAFGKDGGVPPNSATCFRQIKICKGRRTCRPIPRSSAVLTRKGRCFGYKTTYFAVFCRFLALLDPYDRVLTNGATLGWKTFIFQSSHRVVKKKGNTPNIMFIYDIQQLNAKSTQNAQKNKIDEFTI